MPWLQRLSAGQFGIVTRESHSLDFCQWASNADLQLDVALQRIVRAAWKNYRLLRGDRQIAV